MFVYCCTKFFLRLQYSSFAPQSAAIVTLAVAVVLYFVRRCCCCCCCGWQRHSDLFMDYQVSVCHILFLSSPTPTAVQPPHNPSTNQTTRPPTHPPPCAFRFLFFVSFGWFGFAFALCTQQGSGAVEMPHPKDPLFPGMPPPLPHPSMASSSLFYSPSPSAPLLVLHPGGSAAAAAAVVGAVGGAWKTGGGSSVGAGGSDVGVMQVLFQMLLLFVIAKGCLRFSKSQLRSLFFLTSRHTWSYITGRQVSAPV